MQHANRFTPRRGRAALLATACLIVPLPAKDLPAAITAAQRELDQRRIDIEEAKELLEQGDQAYQAKRYADAVTAFSGARELIPAAPITADLRAAATHRLVLAATEHARALSRKGDVAGAQAAVDAVLVPSIAPDDPGALALRNQLDDPIRTSPALTKELVADIDEVRRLLYTAEGAYNAGKYDEAKRNYEKILRLDATNSAARRGLEQLAAAKSGYAKAASDHTRAEMLSQVGAGWELPVPPPILEPGDIDPNAPVERTAMIPVANKLERIIIPSVILEDASLQDAIDLLRLRAAELDLMELDPARRGINFNLEIGGDDSPIGNAIRAIRFNLRLSQVPISKVLEYINEQTKTIYTTDEFSVVIRPHGTDSKELVTRTFRVPPNFVSSLGSTDGAAADADPFSAKPAKGLLTERRGVQELLKEQGIKFPDGASATLSGGSLVVINTPANLDVISEIVDSAAKSEPVLVQVRVTMISAEQSRLHELGFDWLLGNIGFGGAGWIPGTDTLNFSGGTQGTGGNLGDITLPPGQITSNPVTSGNRSGDEAVYKDSIDAVIEATNNSTRFNSFTPRGAGVFAVSKVFDNSSAQVLMRALSQKKGVDIMTAAATVTRNGQASSVRNVREVMYPQSYEPPELPNSVGQDNNDFNNGFNNGGGGGNIPMAVTPSHPTDFTMREVGVILEVTPTADADNRFVDVTLNPQVVDFDGFVNYGSPINAPSTVPAVGIVSPFRAQAVEVSPNRILMPVFSVHRVATSLQVADGATIAIGGLVQDRIQNVSDKTPIYGDIPLLGRLFQSKVDQKIATAVIFLVNVKLIDPTGQPFSER
jgi:general secretion pathway protein D